FDRQGISEEDLIDFTPELKAEAQKIVSQYVLGPMYTPWQMRDYNGKIAAIILPHHTGGANWPGGAADPETGVVYVAALTNPDPLVIAKADPARSDMGYVGGFGGARGGAGRGGPPGAAGAPGRGGAPGAGPGGGFGGGDFGEGMPRGRGIGPQGLPLTKGPW